MGAVSKLLLAAIIIILVFMFFPKYSGGAICFGCEQMACECFGFESDWETLGTLRNMCVGVPYNCELIETPTNETIILWEEEALLP